MAKTLFPETMSFEQPPKTRGVQDDRFGGRRTPLYLLAWRIDPRDLPTAELAALADAYLMRWVYLCEIDPPARITPWPSMKTAVKHNDDDGLYFVVATNLKDPTYFTLDDFKHGKTALPSVYDFLDVNVHDTFKWYRKGMK
ncbi:hypothetical protein MKEN_01208500 [Mycena kentingensis (nom. inval.)]|nr:hypothetical protein MKEN_01208500 [Mycena kentingensis (nom. inval.)]